MEQKKKKTVELINKNIFPLPLKVKCFKCKNTFEIKYVIPHKSYSKKNNWEYWTNPEAKNPDFWKDKEARKKDRQICNACLLKFYYDKETYWETITDLKKRGKLRTYIHEGKFSCPDSSEKAKKVLWNIYARLNRASKGCSYSIFQN